MYIHYCDLQVRSQYGCLLSELEKKNEYIALLKESLKKQEKDITNDEQCSRTQENQNTYTEVRN